MTNPKVESVFCFIVRYKKANDGNSPTNRQIGSACNVSSTSVVAYYLNKLQQDGRITISDEGSRNIQVTNGKWTYEA